MNVKKYIALVLTIVTTVVTLGVGILIGFTLLQDEKTPNDDLPILDKTNAFRFNQKVNVLILGTDGGGVRSDVMMLASINPKKKGLNVLSIPRDTRVKINNRYQKINAALAIGKEELAIRKVKEMTGLPIHYYVTVDFSGFRNIIDILGGVDFEVPMNMRYSDPYQNLYINLDKGMQPLDGAKAEQLVRFRRYPDGDIGRIKTQQAFIKALLEQKMKLGYLSKVDELYTEIKKNVKTNFSMGDVTKHLGAVKVITSDNINMFQLPGQAQTIDGISYFIYDVQQTIQLIKEEIE